MKKYNLILLLALLSIGCLHAKDIIVQSPDEHTDITLFVGEKVDLQVKHKNEILFKVNNIYMNTDRGQIPAKGAKVSNVNRKSVDKEIHPEIKEKIAIIPEKYNELSVSFNDKSELQFRVFNDGVAYRFVTKIDGVVTIYDESLAFDFDGSSQLTYQQDTSMNSDYEAPYITMPVDEMKKGEHMGNLPALIKTPSAKNVVFLEADTKDYPCMWIQKGDLGLEGLFWQYPKTYNEKGNQKNRRRVETTEDYIAKSNGNRTYPWRIFAIAETDKDLLTNQLVYILGPECKIKDPSWIKPGWVTFDWWARRGLYGVDFKSGINNETAKYMIDFAADFGVRYFLFDDGWTYKEDLTRAIDGLDMHEVVKYGESKGVDVMLWVTYDLFDSQMDKALAQFSEWGIKGIKIDFINRSDQEAVDFYWKSAEKCAEHKMVIDYHGAYRPDGMRRAYPNVLTREALIEFEYSGASDKDDPNHHCTLPFIRNVAGPMDYIPGSLNNGTKRSFAPFSDRPMTQGTRAHSMAMTVITESPMQMLSDAQSDYYAEPECTSFITQVPVEWDEIIPLESKLGDFVALARRKGTTWYVAAITDWTPRAMELDLSFLSPHVEYTAEIFADGINADIRARDYKREIKKYTSRDKVKVSLASGGGWVARISQ